MDNKIKCVIQRPGQVSEVAEIENTIEAFKEVIGCNIDIIPISDKLSIVISGERQPKKLKYDNTIIIYGTRIGIDDDCSFGTAIAVADYDGEKCRSLTVTEIQSVREWFLKNSMWF